MVAMLALFVHAGPPDRTVPKGEALKAVNDAGADGILARQAAFRKANPIFSTDFSVSLGGPPAKGHMVVDHETRLYAHFSASGVEYRTVIAPDGETDVNDTTQMYDDWPGFKEIRIAPSRISPFAKAIPAYMIAPSFRGFFTSKTPFSAAGHETDFGVSCDVVHTHFNTQGSSTDVDAAVDATGRIRRVKWVTRAMSGTQTAEWKFSRVDPITRLAANTFRLPVPLGYIPFALPAQRGPIATGSMFPAAGWHSGPAATFNLLQRLGAHGGLVAILGADSEPSVRAEASLRRLRTGLPVVILTDGQHLTPGTDGYDPSGRLLAETNAPDTPVFFLLDGSGKIVSEWMGYSSDRAGEFESAVRAAYGKR